MTNGWQEVSLGSLLTRIKDEVLIQDFEKYQRLTIRTNNKGIEIRDELEGHLIGTKNQYVVHGGQFLLSKIDAMNGAFGIIPEHVENGIITSNFWAYDVDEDKLFSKYFNYLTHTRSFQEFCIQASSGTTHRKYLREDLFLGMEIPLPPLTEQRRIVEHIESLARRVNEAQRLREEADAEIEALQNSMLLQVFEDLEKRFTPLPIGKSNLSFNSQTRNPQKDSPNEEFLYIDIAAVENGTGKITSPQKIQGSNAPSRARRVVKENDVILSTVRPNLKAFAIVPPELDNQICSTGFAVFSNIPEILPEFLLYQFLSPYFVNQAVESVVGGHYPALNDKALNSLEIILPPLDEQQRIVAYLDGLQAKVNALREMQSTGGEELSALMASVLDKAFKGEL